MNRRCPGYAITGGYQEICDRCGRPLTAHYAGLADEVDELGGPVAGWLMGLAFAVALLYRVWSP